MIAEGRFYTRTFMNEVFNKKEASVEMQMKSPPSKQRFAAINNIIFYGCGVVTPLLASAIKILNDLS